MFRKTPLEAWALQKMGGNPGKAGSLTRALIESYQLQKLRETLALARDRSPFYRRLLSNYPAERVKSLRDLRELPFTTERDLGRNPLLFLCVSQDRISRVVTLHSSGTTGLPKRVFFTPGDQELIRDFFHHGMSTLVRPGDTVLILLPGRLPGSVGDLLVEALGRMQARGIPHGFVRDPRETLEIMAREKVDALVGIPTQVLALARWRFPGQKEPPLRVKNVLLTTDHVPRVIVDDLERTWDCRVFNHYGMTEMGLGGGVECEARAGYHLREADLFFEIVDPVTGEIVSEGEEGEVVFTTLTRRGMPLIRYRTGDLARFIPGPCPCGSGLKRMAPVKDRVEGRILLSGGGLLSMSVLDETLFKINGLVNFQAVVYSKGGTDCLEVRFQTAPWAGDEVPELVKRALLSLPVIAENLCKGTLTLGSVAADDAGELWRPVKRMIQDRREKGGTAHERVV
ncbi:MAG TPA: phenylacetate--CoA ligase family protein [Desulfotomaculum sp.]|nr:phenylacetate--CoA ligase family protein [Desulfotomaculum sp.]